MGLVQVLLGDTAGRLNVFGVFLGEVCGVYPLTAVDLRLALV